MAPVPTTSNHLTDPSWDCLFLLYHVQISEPENYECNKIVVVWYHQALERSVPRQWTEGMSHYFTENEFWFSEFSFSIDFQKSVLLGGKGNILKGYVFRTTTCYLHLSIQQKVQRCKSSAGYTSDLPCHSPHTDSSSRALATWIRFPPPLLSPFLSSPTHKLYLPMGLCPFSSRLSTIVVPL